MGWGIRGGGSKTNHEIKKDYEGEADAKLIRPRTEKEENRQRSLISRAVVRSCDWSSGWASHSISAAYWLSASPHAHKRDAVVNSVNVH